ncbi:MAG TPA: ribonuclease J [Candidatus Latescibacteria bacterium]|nr:ribonuclease J [Candidatus Latescibacterota bacterium]
MTEASLRVIPLGGLGEIGKNMMALEYGDDIVVIDSGVLFPSEEMPGIDFAIPDISYLKENSSRVRAILITHGHEDHIGALPYVLSELNVPVYASRLTHGLISVKLKEFGLLKDARLNVVEPHSPFKIGAFKAEFFRVCHSIPDAMGIALQTPLGTVIHTGDFKIDHTPADGKSTDFAALSQLTGGGVLLLLSDSTYAESEGYTESEQVVGQALEREIIGAEGRVLVATFASLISRMQQVIDAAVKCDRKVAVIGRSMINNVKMATNMGYLKAPAGTIIPLREASNLPLNKIVILATGAQGEPTSALVRISNGDHQDVEIVPGDTVIISASPIPGNETLVSRTIDNLYRQKARVLHSKIALVHVHGHASREELKMMLAMIKPKFFVPVHGEYRHLVAHAEIACSMGVTEANVMVLEDGDVLELTADHGTIVDRIPAGHVYVNGRRMWGDDGKVLAERGRLAREGVVTVVVSVDASSGEVVNAPSLLSSGFVELDESADLLERTSEEAQIALEQPNGRRLELDELRALVSNSVSKFLYDETRRRPKVLTHIQEV